MVSCASGTNQVSDAGPVTGKIDLSIAGISADAASLTSGTSCNALNSALRVEAEKNLRNFWETYNPCNEIMYDNADGGAISSTAESDSATDQASPSDYSEQNSQVDGVLEPDSVFTNGEIIAAIDPYDDVVRLYRAWPIADMEYLATINGVINSSTTVRFNKIILSGDILYGFGTYTKSASTTTGSTSYTYYGAVVAYDLSNPELPQALVMKSVENTSWNNNGRLRDGRLLSTFNAGSVGPTVDYFPDWDWEEDGDQCDDDTVKPAYQTRIEEHIESEVTALAAYDLADELPAITTTNLAAGNSSQTRQLGCSDVLYNQYTVGSALTLIVDSNAEDLTETDRVKSVMDFATTIYLNHERLILASSVNNNLYTVKDNQERETTASLIHVFYTDSNGLEYQASTVLPGHVPSAFAIDEDDGLVRVVTEVNFVDDDEENDCCDFMWAPVSDDIALNVLRLHAGSLTLVGQKDNIIADEDVWAVRYLGDTVYLVTYRVTYYDPLFVLDTSDETAPVVLGQLTTPGVSMYLHPLEDGRVLGTGLGTDCSNGTCWFNDSVQIGLFDASTQELPVQADLVTIDDANSQASWDHLAVHYNDETGHLYIPYEQWVYTSSNWNSNLKVNDYEISADGISLERTFAVDDDLNTLSRTLHFTDDDDNTTLVVVGYAGIQAFDADSGEEITTIIPYISHL
jgi:uncharacterized secreted protein with C-terminal beta-propeller domain